MVLLVFAHSFVYMGAHQVENVSKNEVYHDELSLCLTIRQLIYNVYIKNPLIADIYASKAISSFLVLQHCMHSITYFNTCGSNS